MNLTNEVPEKQWTISTGPSTKMPKKTKAKTKRTRKPKADNPLVLNSRSTETVSVRAEKSEHGYCIPNDGRHFQGPPKRIFISQSHYKLESSQDGVWVYRRVSSPCASDLSGKCEKSPSRAKG